MTQASTLRITLDALLWKELTREFFGITEKQWRRYWAQLESQGAVDELVDLGWEEDEDEPSRDSD